MWDATHHYHVELFDAIVDKQFVELNSRFDEVNIELLLCLETLSPDDSFLAFDEQKLICFSQFYPNEFTTCQLLALEDQLGHYIIDMRSSSEFSQLKGIGRNRVYNNVYLLITLPLVLLVATASVEKAFSAMNIAKISLHNRMGDQTSNIRTVYFVSLGS
ncbi:hypothetical protein DVH24_012851 [Malus domestica]|uniref:HAT C-terminal dimerisation domain-containing protein n=1 Tax=Malus domestica TaxID=3750 RepID=A0A498HUI9_MALDO|nr:hypothetical protein DVH24_012851 [Malus domestica]